MSRDESLQYIVDCFDFVTTSRYTNILPRSPIVKRHFDVIVRCLYIRKGVVGIHARKKENEEAGCFFVAEPSKDIKRRGGDIKQWISRSQKHLNL